jgi:hypothetical protein
MALGFRGCSIFHYLLVFGGLLAISIVTVFNHTWPTFSEPKSFLPEHSEVEEVRQIRIAIEETGGSLSFYLLEQLDAAL